MNIVPASAEEIWALEPGKYSWVQGEPLIWQPSDTPTGALRVLITVSSSETAAGTKTVDLRYVDGAIDRVSYMGEHTSAGIRWVKIATATPPAVYDFAYSAGWGKHQTSFFCKLQNGLVLGCFCALSVNLTPQSGGILVATMPEGFRPKAVVEGVSGGAPGGDTTVFGGYSIYPNGNVYIGVQTPIVSTRFSFFYETA